MKLAWDQYALDARYTPEPHVPEIAMRTDVCMESDSGQRATKSGLRDRRYAIRYPFAAGAEILDLKSGTRLSCVTSDLSLGGCFVCTRRPLAVGRRVRFTLRHEAKTLTGIAMVRVSKPRAGMGL